MKYYLVEAYSPDLEFEHSEAVIALAPLAAYQLDKAGINYNIIEDYYDEGELLKEEEAYFRDQLTWFGKFDNFLFNIFPDAKRKDLKLATIHYFCIKSMVDSLILRCKVINIFINKVKPDKIIYISNSWKEDLIDSAVHPLLFGRGQSLFSRIMPIFCKKYNIDFQRIILKQAVDLNNIHPKYKSFISRVKSGLMTNNHVRNLWHYYKTFSINSRLFESSKNHRRNLFFLKNPGFVKDIIKEALEKGYGVYYKRNNDIINQSFPYHKVVVCINSNITSDPTYGNNFLKEIELNDILSWVNNYCGININSILLARLKYFINNFCPQILSLIDKYTAFYNDNQIDMVFTPHMVSESEFAAIAATRYAEKTMSACLQHGDAAFAAKRWDFGEYAPYYIYFTTNYEREEYIKHRIQLGNFKTKVFQYPNRFKIIPKVNRPKRKQNRRGDQKTLVYVPIMYPWDSEIWSESRLPDTWYFSWHKKLMNYFSSRKDFNFIWKGIPDSNVTYDPTSNIINDQKYKNIKYATESFVKWIKKADLVLLDYPSTALYEAAVSGLPVMSLFFAPFSIVRESALKLFGRSLQPFSSFDEGISKIDAFLNSNLNEFVVSIPRSGKSITETLETLITSRS